MKIEIEKLDHFARGITKIGEKICFVENALPNEIVEIDNIKEKKKYFEASTKHIIKESKDRIKTLCKYYNICGGCNIEHLNYEVENIYKKEKLVELITHHNDLNKDIIKDTIYDKEYYYRNKIVLHVKDGKLGLFERKTNKLIEIDECLLVNNKINEVISFLKNINNLKDIEQVTIKVGNKTNEVMLIIKGDLKEYLSLLEIVDVLIINNKVLSNKSSILSYIGDKKYYISENSFFQVNEKITEKLYNKIKDEIESYNVNNVLDLYCGTGTIGIYICEKVNKVLGIEIVEDGIKDAIRNKELNNIENIDFKVGKVEELINDIEDDYSSVIVDPPRSGLDNKVIKYLNTKIKDLIIYVSCDPNTLVRDLKLLEENYKVLELTPYNMFPRTYHVECISVLERKSVEK